MKKANKRKYFRRVAGTLLATVLLLGIAACGKNGGDDISGTSDTPATDIVSETSIAPTVNPGGSVGVVNPTSNPGGAGSGDSGSDVVVVPPDLQLTAGGIVIAGDPASGVYTVASARGPVYVQEFEPSYAQPKVPGMVNCYTNMLAALDPAVSNQTEHGWCYNVYEPLFMASPDGTGEWMPVLATDWYYDDEGNFHAILREGVKFHDGGGRIMTAEDVLYSIERVIKMPTSPASAGMQGVDIENSYAENDYHVVIKFKQPVGGFMNYMGCSYLSIVNKEVFEEKGPDFDWWDMSAGTGAYYCVETITGLSQTFKRFDDYWGGKPVMDTIVLMSQIQATVMGVDLENGDFVVALQCNLDSINRVLSGEVTGIDYMLLSVHRGFHMRIAMEPETKPFHDFRVREAFAMSLNLEEVAIATYGSLDLAKPADKQMLNGITVEVPEYNPDKAREIMSSLGYGPDNPCVLEIMTSTTEANVLIMEAVQAMANECYFQVNPTIAATGLMTEDSNSTEFPSKWDGIIAGIQVYIDAEIFYMDCDAYEKEVGQYSGLKANTDPEFARLFRLLPLTDDQDERQEIIDQLNIMYQENLYFLPLIINCQPILVQNYMKNVTYRDGMGLIWKDLQYKDWVDYTP